MTLYAVPSSVTENGDLCFEGVAESTVTRVTIETSGTDAYWLDQWHTYSYSSNDCSGTGTLKVTQGADNQVGYCFSTQPSDYSTPDPVVCSLAGVDGHANNGGVWPGSYWWMYWNY